LDDPREIQELVQGAKMPLMIVGHLPYLSRLASLLVLGTTDKEIIKFTKGAVVCFDRSDDIWSIQWALIPELVKE
jgi:phosphohistidine phosphatase